MDWVRRSLVWTQEARRSDEGEVPLRGARDLFRPVVTSLRSGPDGMA